MLNLDTTVEELTVSVWQFHLHNLSDQVLGFHNKMNQLKSQETRIRQVAREAEEFASLRQKAHQLFDEISDRSRSVATEQTSAAELTEKIKTSLRESTELGQKMSSLSTQIEQYETTAAQQIAKAKQDVADTEAIAIKSKELQIEIESARNSFQELITQVQHLLTSTETTGSTQIADFGTKFEQLITTTQTTIATLTTKLETSIAELSSNMTTKLDSLTSSVDARLIQLVTDTSTRLTQTETSHESRLSGQLQEFIAKSESNLSNSSVAWTAQLQSFTEKGADALKTSDTEFNRLVANLGELEGRIRDSIERATGYTLFHAFQKRQQDIAKSKRFWGIALATTVSISLIASGWFIYSLQFVQAYNVAFYLKLSFSIPLIYAIAFCNVQYSRERRLEEEYAFKSSISISLDPYQKLVGELVDKTSPEEIAKYTAFAIDSVNRVFTSPTTQIFESPGDKNSAEKIIKAVGEVIEPLIKALKR